MAVSVWLSFIAEPLDVAALTAVTGVAPTKTSRQGDVWTYEPRLTPSDDVMTAAQPVLDLFAPRADTISAYCRANGIRSSFGLWITSQSARLPSLALSPAVVALCAQFGANVDSDMYIGGEADILEAQDAEPVFSPARPPTGRWLRTRARLDFVGPAGLGDLERLTGLSLTPSAPSQTTWTGPWSDRIDFDDLMDAALTPLVPRADTIREFAAAHGVRVEVVFETRSAGNLTPVLGFTATTVQAAAALGAWLRLDIHLADPTARSSVPGDSLPPG